MAKIKYIESDGREHQVDVPNGCSVMEGAVKNNVAGVVAECGGCCSCATCHVHVDPEFAALLPPMTADEDDLLDSSDDRDASSRLSCQIPFTENLDGLRVRIAEED